MSSQSIVPIPERNRQLLQMRKDGVPRREVALRFGLSPNEDLWHWKIWIWVRGKWADASGLGAPLQGGMAKEAGRSEAAVRDYRADAVFLANAVIGSSDLRSERVQHVVELEGRLVEDERGGPILPFRCHSLRDGKEDALALEEFEFLDLGPEVFGGPEADDFQEDFPAIGMVQDEVGHEDGLERMHAFL